VALFSRCLESFLLEFHDFEEVEFHDFEEVEGHGSYLPLVIIYMQN